MSDDAERPSTSWGERAFLALGLILFATCAHAQAAPPDSAEAKPNVAVWSPAHVRRTLDSLFHAFEMEPAAAQVICVEDYHAFPSETQPGVQMVLLFRFAPATGEHCGRSPVLLFDLRCRGFSAQDQATINALQIPMVAFVCRRADGRLWFNLLMPSGPRT